MTSVFEDQQSTLKDAISRFDELGINYMLTGSMAMVNYAMMRMTNDIDIVIEVSSNDSSAIAAKFEPDYYVPHRQVREGISNKRMFNLLHQRTLVKIDCVVRKDDDFAKEAFSRRQKVQFQDFELWVTSKEDLMLSKLNWAKKTGSEMQLRDVANILRNGYDEKYVEMWAEKLDIEKLLDQALQMIDDKYVEGYDS